MINDRARVVVQRTWLYDFYQRCCRAFEIRRWHSLGRPVPPPHGLKVSLVKSFARRFNLPVFVETGTLFGQMIYAVRKDFRSIYSIEIEEGLFLRATRRFAAYPHITILKGDSAKVLPELLQRIDTPCLFWLDGHYSGGMTGRGENDTPILQELESIWAIPGRKHVVLIDDARLFGSDEGYPKQSEVRELAELKQPGYVFDVRDDIIIMYPKD